MTFDDSRLDAPLDPLAEGVLRRLASTGARIRRDCADLDKVRRTVGEWGSLGEFSLSALKRAWCGLSLSRYVPSH